MNGKGKVHKAEMSDEEREDERDNAGPENEEAEEQKKEREREKREASKSVPVEDLLKSLTDYDAIEAATTTAGSGSRESFLKARLDAGTITKSERSELGALWAGDTNEPIRKSFTDTVTEDNEDLVDASPFLKSLVDTLGSRLDGFQGEIALEGRAGRELAKAQGQVIRSIAHVVVDLAKSDARKVRVLEALEKRLGIVETAPVVRKSVGRVDPRDVRAAPGRDAEGGENISKAQAFEGLARLAMKADRDSNDGLSKSVAFETARLEGQGKVSPKMLPLIKEALGQ